MTKRRPVLRLSSRQRTHFQANPLRIRRMITELHALHEIRHAINQALELDTVLEEIYSQTSRLMDTRQFYLALYSPELQLIEFALAVENGQRVSWPSRPYADGLTEWILQHRRPLRINDHDHNATVAPIIVGQPVQSFLGVPIVLGEQVLGVISVQSVERVEAYSSHDEQILSMIADQAAVAIAHAKRFAAVDQQLQARVAQLETLEATIRDLNETLDVDTILNRLLDRIQPIMHADAGMVCLLDPEQQRLYIRAIQGYPAEIRRFQFEGWPIDRGIAGLVARTGQPDWTADIRNSGYYVNSRPTTLSQMTVPIVHSGKVLGVMILESDRVGTFNQDTTRFVSQIADHAALSIHNAHIHQQAVEQQALLAQRSQQLNEVLRISQALSANLNLNDLLPEIVRAIQASLGFNIALLSLVDQERPSFMRRRAVAGVPDERWFELRDQLVPIDWYRSVMREEFRISRSYYIPHSHTSYTAIWGNSDDTYRADLGERRPHEWHQDDALFVPLYDSDNNLISILSVDDPRDRRKPSFESVQVLEIFATQAAIAIENAHLYTITQQLAITDGLTGLFNQRHFITMLDREVALAYRYEYPLSLLALDIDYFKQYNDNYGHLVGNVLLRDFARLVCDNVRDVDIVSRNGGEEFTIILPKTDQEGAVLLAERLRICTAEHLFGQGHITVSIGVATLNNNWDAHTLHDQADQALYRAKNSGRNLVISVP
ncbi:diguanylate cyclase [Herpetosiphon sp. NSE202]|uniref:diguanylate cyclase n=1 Tax=Herpetosiphon sp. NSE202 TaxID=3351349 RepID=UPI003626C878